MTDPRQPDERTDAAEAYRATGTDGPAASRGAARGTAPGALQRLAAERLAAHRARQAALGRGALNREPADHEAQTSETSSAAHGDPLDEAAVRVREAVAARYRESQSYREYLAAESARALEHARAEAEIAQRRADAMAAAQQQLMKELDAWRTPGDAGAEPSARSGAGPLPALGPALVPARLVVAAVAADPVVADPVAADLALVDALADVSPGAEGAVGSPALWPAAEPVAGLSVRLYDELAPAALAAVLTPASVSITAASVTAASVALPEGVDPLQEADDLEGLEAELDFRMAPDFGDHRIEIVPIQANILHFPRELVAPVKARPRLAEGPLRTDADAAMAASEMAGPAPWPTAQLRIFEILPEVLPESLPEILPEVLPEIVEILPAISPETVAENLPAIAPEHLDPSSTPDAMTIAASALALPEIAAPGWQGVLPAQAPARLPEAWPEHWPAGAPSLLMPVYAAAAERRLLSGLVDGSLIAAACVTLASTAVLACGQHVPHYPLWALLPGSFVAAVAVAVLYHWLFFSFAEATPGMRYARLALCTFHDASPTRRQRQARVGALLLAALPLGWGLLSMAFEIDHLGAHDKRSRMYPREY